MAAPVRCFKHTLLQLHQSIGKDVANFNQICKQKPWMDAFLAFMEEHKNEALNQGDGLECFCNEDTDGTTKSNATLRLGSSWVSAPAHDVAVLHDVEDEEQFVFFCAGDDSSEPEWIENEDPNFHQRYLSQEQA